MRELVEFIKASLSSNKSESFSRTACAIVLYFLLLWTTYVVGVSNEIPDIPLQWGLLVSTLYLGGKALDKRQPEMGGADVAAGQDVPQ